MQSVNFEREREREGGSEDGEGNEEATFFPSLSGTLSPSLDSTPRVFLEDSKQLENDRKVMAETGPRGVLRRTFLQTRNRKSSE